MELPSLSKENIFQDHTLNKIPDRNSDLREVAEQFEAIFINQILKQSRETKLADDLLGSSPQLLMSNYLIQRRQKISLHMLILVLLMLLFDSLKGTRSNPWQA